MDRRLGRPCPAVRSGIAWRFGRQPAVEYLTGYVIEYALSVDNLFVFILIFKTFGVPRCISGRSSSGGSWER